MDDSKDPRTRNELPAASSVGEYLAGYSRELSAAIAKVPSERLTAAFALMSDALARQARIWSAGNGGSAAIADHLCCDWMKGTHVPGKPALRASSLTSSVAVLTALANDFSFETAIARQVEMQCDPGDVLVLISSSGNSPNIVNAAEAARARDVKVIGLSGFAGGKLAAAADVSLHVPVANYGLAEDAHQMIMHALAQFLAKQRDARS